MRLLVGHDDTVAGWVGNKFGEAFIPPFLALGIIDKTGLLRGGLVIRPCNTSTCDLTVYSEGAITPGIWRKLWQVIFLDLNFARCVVQTHKKNKPLKQVIPKLGFKFEGVAKNFYGVGHDALQFSMTPDICRWLRARGEHGSRR